jgi:hypothetical protein
MKKVLAIAALFVFICSGCKYFEKKRLFSKGADTMLNYAAEIDETTVEDTMEFYSGIGDDQTRDMISDSLESLYQPQETTAGSDNVYMVVGCFLIPQNADNFSEKIRTMGYQSEIILRADGFHLVTASSYASVSEGARDLQKFRDEISESAWLWVKR